jgi:hypothetical protein
MRHGQLFLRGHAATRRLFAIAQSGIKENYVIWIYAHLPPAEDKNEYETSLLIRQLNTVRVPHPFPRFLRKWVGMRCHCFLAGSIVSQTAQP